VPHVLPILVRLTLADARGHVQTAAERNVLFYGKTLDGSGYGQTEIRIKPGEEEDPGLARPVDLRTGFDEIESRTGL
jgi:hypothetical protein